MAGSVVRSDPIHRVRLQSGPHECGHYKPVKRNLTRHKLEPNAETDPNPSMIAAKPTKGTRKNPAAGAKRLHVPLFRVEQQAEGESHGGVPDAHRELNSPAGPNRFRCLPWAGVTLWPPVVSERGDGVIFRRQRPAQGFLRGFDTDPGP